jgi:secondary thiamine-phosphate synthase enzyme
MYVLSVETRSRRELIDITSMLLDILKQNPISEGVCVVFIPHTTAAVTINENADPFVRSDILLGLERLTAQKDFRHREGNSDAHLSASLLGSSQMIPIENGALVLGTWQGVYLAEFDGPRSRKVMLTFIAHQDAHH